jgi:hypothetical protein
MISQVDLDDNDDTFEPGQVITDTDRNIKSAHITWKGDSRVFAVNYRINAGYKCLTRDINMDIVKGPARADKDIVVDKNVFSVSERPVKNMRLPIAMMPSGSLIAGFQITQTENGEAKHEIIFWEKNGLRHGQIELPKFKSISSPDSTGHLPIVYKFEFNSDSTFLACLIDFDGDRTTDTSIPDRQIIILNRSNYHWFIKRSIKSVSDHDIIDFGWFSSKKNQMVIVDRKANL